MSGTTPYHLITVGCVALGLGWAAGKASPTVRASQLEAVRMRQQADDNKACNERIIETACALSQQHEAFCKTAVVCPDGGTLYSGCK